MLPYCTSEQIYLPAELHNGGSGCHCQKASFQGVSTQVLNVHFGFLLQERKGFRNEILQVAARLCAGHGSR